MLRRSYGGFDNANIFLFHFHLSFFSLCYSIKSPHDRKPAHAYAVLYSDVTARARLKYPGLGSVLPGLGSHFPKPEP